MIRIRHDQATLAVAALLITPGAAIVPASLGLISFGAALVCALPLVLATGVALIYTRRILRPVTMGVVAGLAATLAYDTIRWILQLLGYVQHPFRSIELYGEVLLGAGSISHPVGWIFHFWNGCTFGVFYAVAFAPSTLVRAIAWGLALEFALVITSPALLALTIKGEIFASSLIGHIAYGLALHLVLRRVSPRRAT